MSHRSATFKSGLRVVLDDGSRRWFDFAELCGLRDAPDRHRDPALRAPAALRVVHSAARD